MQKTEFGPIRYDPVPADPYTYILLSKIVVGGGFVTFGGNPHSRIARLNADGTEDTSFTLGANFMVWCIAKQYQYELVGQIIAPCITNSPDSCPPLRPGPLPR